MWKKNSVKKTLRNMTIKAKNVLWPQIIIIQCIGKICLVHHLIRVGRIPAFMSIFHAGSIYFGEFFLTLVYTCTNVCKIFLHKYHYKFLFISVNWISKKNVLYFALTIILLEDVTFYLFDIYLNLLFSSHCWCWD